MARASRRPPAKIVDSTAANVTRRARKTLLEIQMQVIECRACPRLVAWREETAANKRASYANEEYWGRGVPGFGDPAARILFLGLAPAAHGANRTGRIFTGDRSGDWLFGALYRSGLANQPTSIRREDGLELSGAWVTSAVKCAPPANKPLPQEKHQCHGFLEREIRALENLQVVVCLGAFAYEVATTQFAVRPRPRFGHGVEVETDDGSTLICSFHPSQQNTFTGRLTEEMLDDVIRRAVEIAGPFSSRERVE